MNTKIIALCGSIRQPSSNHRILEEIGRMLPESEHFEIYDGMNELPFFDPNIEDELVSLKVMEFRREIEHAKAVIICTPEYVFSIPGLLKNALEWTVSTVVFSDKPTAVITASSLGDRCHESLQLVMKTIGARMNEETTLLIGNVRSKLNAEGRISDPGVKAAVKRLVDALMDMR